MLATLTLENFEPGWFWGLIIALSLAVLALTYAGMYRRSGSRLTWTLLALRVLGVLALLVALVKPVWEQRVEQRERPQLGVIVDDSQSMTLPHPDRGGSAWTPRYEKARRWLNQSDAGQRLREQFDVRFFDAAGRPLDEGALPGEATAEQTDLLRGLRGAAQQMRGRHVAGVVLISDGRDTTGRDSFIALEDYPHPIYAIGYRQPESRRGSAADIALTAVDAPARTLVHNTVNVNVTLRKDGGDAATVPVHIQRAGETLLTESVNLDAGRTERQVTLNYTPDEPGLFTLTTRVSPGTDRTTVNNARMFRLRVEAEPIRVLYVEGVLRPEAKFLRQHLDDDPDVDLITFARAASPQQVGSAIALGQMISDDQFEQLDVVLLGDFEARMLDPQAYTSLRTWVENGGGLMVLGGYENFGPAGLMQTPLSNVLPVRIDNGSVQQLNEAFAFTLTEEGKRHPALTVTGDRVRDARLWRELPNLQGIVAVPDTKAGATVLARHPRRNPSDAQGNGYPVLAVQRFDEGVSAVMLADTTWRWSRLTRLAGQPDTMYVRFWSQMVRWLAQREDPTAQTPLTVSTDAASYQRGRTVNVTVQRNPAAVIPGESDNEAQTDLTLSVRQPDGRRNALPAQRSTTDPHRWTAQYVPTRGGRYVIDASLQRSGDASDTNVTNQTAEFLVEGAALELHDPATNPTALQQIAPGTGGAYFDIDAPNTAQQILAQLDTDPRVTQQVQRSAVWHSPALFVAFLVLMCTEWLIRRRNRLV